MLTSNGVVLSLLGALAMIGAVLAGGADHLEDEVPSARATPSTTAELARVVGLDDSVPAEAPWEEKCCADGGPCTPNAPPPVLPAFANCWQKQAYSPNGLFRAGCNGQWSCYAFVGPKAHDAVCVPPPNGAIIVPQCRSAGNAGFCQKYKTGACVANFALYCVCELDAAEHDSAGKKSCDPASTPCVGIVPPAQPN